MKEKHDRYYHQLWGVATADSYDLQYSVTCLLLLVGEVGRFDVAPSPSMSNTPTLKFWGRRENRILRSTTNPNPNVTLHLHT